jgi:hypothetical protein
MKSNDAAFLIVNELRRRQLDDGGFAGKPGGTYRPDATAWAMLALASTGDDAVLLKKAGSKLARSRLADGSVAMSGKWPAVAWPTSPAVLAWMSVPGFDAEVAGSVRFLLENLGVHWERKPDSPLSHDTAIKGWPWVTGNHSWVEPTALGVIALCISGNSGHDRVGEGIRLLEDRQLSSGGWNYGNTRVFGKELEPMPENTGVALSALAGMTPKVRIGRSLSYLATSVPGRFTPLSLGWGLLGLSAYGDRPAEAEEMILTCLRRQTDFPPYDTAALSILLTALVARNGLIGLFGHGGLKEK